MRSARTTRTFKISASVRLSSTFRSFPRVARSEPVVANPLFFFSVLSFASLADAAQEEKAPIFFAKVRAVAERTGGRNVEPPLKGMQRCQDKAQFKYKDSSRRLTYMMATRGLDCWRFLCFSL